MSRLKKSIGLLLCVLLLLESGGIFAFAENKENNISEVTETTDTNETTAERSESSDNLTKDNTLNESDTVNDGCPFIFVHGMGAWGSYEKFNDVMPYWGGWGFNADGDMIKILNDSGVSAYAASVGPFNSAWDRACELYAELTGTTVDYGAAHSAEHKHDRYGYSYKNNYLMDKPWDGSSKINLVGHSFGASTVRLFASLMAFGDEAERNATGNDTSPLFLGNHGNAINAVVTIAGTNNGSPIANYVYDTKIPMMVISFGFNLLGSIFGDNLMMWNFRLGHFGLTPKQGETVAKRDIRKIVNFYLADDNCGYDMTLRGAAELNESTKIVPTAYYYSYSARATETDENDNEIPIDSMFTMFKPSSKLLGKLDGKTIDNVALDKSWEINDGLVPLASARYPMTDANTARAYEDAKKNGESIEPGRWYFMPTIDNCDHFDFCSMNDFQGEPDSLRQFYFSLVNTVNENCAVLP